MREKAPLLLMEQLLMVLVFALAAAVCVQAFVLSDRLSKDSEALDHAVVAAENAAEAWKHAEGDLTLLLQAEGGQLSQGLWWQLLDEDWKITEETADACYTVEVFPDERDEWGVRYAQVRVCPVNEDDVIYTLRTACQEAET